MPMKFHSIAVLYIETRMFYKLPELLLLGKSFIIVCRKFDFNASLTAITYYV